MLGKYFPTSRGLNNHKGLSVLLVTMNTYY